MSKMPAMTAADPEPEVGSKVRDSMGRLWIRMALDPGISTWLNLTHEDDPESWIKVAGNYGPVTPEHIVEAVREARRTPTRGRRSTASATLSRSASTATAASS